MMTKRLSAYLAGILLILSGCAGQASSPAHPDAQQEEPWISDAHFVDAGHGWLVLNRRTVLATADGGKTWTNVHEARAAIGHLQFASPLTGWALAPGRLLATADGGRNWTPVATTGIPAFERLDLAAGQPAWASHQGRLYRSTDGGATWAPVNSPCPDRESFGPFSFVDLQTGWILCRGEVKGIGWMDKTLYRTKNGARDWRAITAGGLDEKEPGLPGGYVADLFFLDATHGWYSEVRHGSLHATTNGGRSWRRVPGPDGQAVQHLSFVSAQTGAVVELQQGRYRLITTADGGATWVERYATPAPAR